MTTSKKPKKSSARKISKTPTRNIIFGVVGDHPFSHEVNRVINHQLHYAHIYQTALIELELERRQRERDHLKTLDPELFETALQIDRFSEEIDVEYKKLHSVQRRNCTRNPNAEALRADVTERIRILKDQRRPLYDKQRERQEEIVKTHFVEGDRIQKRIQEAAEAEMIATLGHKPGPNSKAKRELIAIYDERIRQCPDLQREWLDRYEIRRDIEQKRKVIVDRMHTGELFAEAIAKNEAEAQKYGYDAPDRTLYTGSYQGADDAFEAAKKTAGLNKPHFDGEGRIGIQVVKGPHPSGNGKADRTWADLCAGKIPGVRVTDRCYLGGEMVRSHQRTSDERCLVNGGRVNPHARERQSGEVIRSKHLVRTKTRRKVLTFSIRLAEARIKDGVELIHKDRWIDVPVIIHRDIPLNAAIKRIWITVKKINNQISYNLMITFEHESFGVSRLKAKEAATIAVVLGWKTQKDGRVRIATTYDGHEIKEFQLHQSTGCDNKRGARYYRQWDNSINGLLKVADRCFDATKSRLEEWLEAHPVDNLTDPFDRDLSLPTLSHWKSHRRLHRLTFAMLRRYAVGVDIESFWRAWKTECGVPFKGSPKAAASPKDLFSWEDEGHLGTMLSWFEAHGIADEMARMALYLEWWRRKDAHLTTWARLEQKRMKLSIREVYRCEALRLAQRYSTIALLKWDKAKAAKKPTLDKDTRTQQEVEAASIRQFAGPSGFALALKDAAGEAFQMFDAQDIPSTCCHCGRAPVPTNDDDIGYDRQCASCKITYRRDENRVINLWRIATLQRTNDKAAE